MDYPAFFSIACGDGDPPREPYDYQSRLAALPCESRLISIPTGLGKTAAVILAWLWNRVHQPNSKWPRRLVYCLPMRTLVEQTRDEAKKWIDNLFTENPDLLHGKKPRVVILMGGENLEPDAKDWDLYPEENAILIGTQDMLLSRALNRGYGMSRYRWPMHFGLLNNDCLWVMDETQLMGPGLATACQLEAFRGNAAGRFSSFPESRSITWYASATASPDHLQTREWRNVTRDDSFFFDLKQEKNAATGPVAERLGATKKLKIDAARNFGGKQKEPDATLIREIVGQHRAMVEALQPSPSSIPRRSLVICNTVDRALRVHTAIQAFLSREAGVELLLMHSRFRPHERRSQAERLKSAHLSTCPGGQIVVATQVIEAGVDLSSGLLWTEVAPLASIVQRFGRLNRGGEFGFNKKIAHGFEPRAIVLGIEAPAIAGSKVEQAAKGVEAGRAFLPYDRSKCLDTLDTLSLLNADASPRHLDTIKERIDASVDRCPYSLQHHELLDFFDTDANLSLGFTDVSPFVRGLDEDTDVHVLWRESWLQEDGEDGTGKPGFTPDYQRDELCPVPIGRALQARDVLNQGWLWRGREAGWTSVRDTGIVPGMTILLPLYAGGYDEDAGWTGGRLDNKHLSRYQQRTSPSDEEQLSSLANGWQSIAVHSHAVGLQLQEILRGLLLTEEAESSALTLAVPWHDLGKNHGDWQAEVASALSEAGIHGKEAHQPFAKFSLSESPLLAGSHDGSLKKQLRKLKNSFRPGLAHEAASALAFRQAEQARLGVARDTDFVSLLAEYVIMSHHGRVRKVLRDEIPRFPASEKETHAVRGITGGCLLPPIEVMGQTIGGVPLSIDCRKMGRDSSTGHESYTRGVLRLLEHYGPFRLAFFEALFRAADMRASALAKTSPADETHG